MVAALGVGEAAAILAVLVGWAGWERGLMGFCAVGTALGAGEAAAMLGALVGWVGAEEDARGG